LELITTQAQARMQECLVVFARSAYGGPVQASYTVTIKLTHYPRWPNHLPRFDVEKLTVLG
jgi:hypothetical protein